MPSNQQIARAAAERIFPPAHCEDALDPSRTVQRRKAVDIILAAIAESQAWRPIDSAPKDGGTVLLFRKYIQTGYYSQRYERWFACVDSQTINPTHWQPLPLPPPKE